MSAKTFVPALFSLPSAAYVRGAVADDPRDVRERLDVVDAGRLAPEPFDRGERRPRPRHAALALDRGDERRLLAAHERAGALAHLNAEVEAAAEDVLAEEPALLGLRDRDAQALDRERVLGAHVDVALARADRVRGDREPFEDRVRVAFGDAAVHERAGVALVGVADDVLDVARHVAREAPLHAGREAGAASAAKAGLLERGDDVVRRHLGERPAERLVGAPLDRVVDVLRVDDAAVAKHDALLDAVERDVVVVRERLAGGSPGLPGSRKRYSATGPASPRMLSTMRAAFSAVTARVEDVVGTHDGDGAEFAQSVAARAHDAHAVGCACRGDGGLDLLGGQRASRS